MKRILLLAMIVLVLSGCLFQRDAEKVTDDDFNVLNKAINKAYENLAIHQELIEKFGEVKPYDDVFNAEQKRISNLVWLYYSYDKDKPVNKWLGKVPEFESVKEACEASVAKEKENVEFYAELLATALDEEVLDAVWGLKGQSEHEYLPAFQQCVADYSS